MYPLSLTSLLFFFNDTATTEIYTLSLHDALPISFVERLIGTLRREYLDHMLFWTTADLENKLLDFRTYFNNHRTHNSLAGQTPRSEEHTAELQSPPHLVCRPLPGKKKKHIKTHHRL